MKAPRGFRFAGIHAGIKASRKDLALIAADVPCAAAARFTRNVAAAAPIVDARSRFPSTTFQALVITSGNANALTGAQGVDDCRALCTHGANELGVPPSSVLAAATGVIGVRWPLGKLLAAARPLVEARGPHLGAAAEAILTTDTRVKIVTRDATIGGRPVYFAAIAKGSGMVAPSLATVLVAITTDAHVAVPVLDAVLGRVCARTFEQLDLEGSKTSLHKNLEVQEMTLQVQMELQKELSRQLELQKKLQAEMESLIAANVEVNTNTKMGSILSLKAKLQKDLKDHLRMQHQLLEQLNSVVLPAVERLDTQESDDGTTATASAYADAEKKRAHVSSAPAVSACKNSSLSSDEDDDDDDDEEEETPSKRPKAA